MLICRYWLQPTIHQLYDVYLHGMYCSKHPYQHANSALWSRAWVSLQASAQAIWNMCKQIRYDCLQACLLCIMLRCMQGSIDKPKGSCSICNQSVILCLPQSFRALLEMPTLQSTLLGYHRFLFMKGRHFCVVVHVTKSAWKYDNYIVQPWPQRAAGSTIKQSSWHMLAQLFQVCACCPIIVQYYIVRSFLITTQILICVHTWLNVNMKHLRPCWTLEEIIP